MNSLERLNAIISETKRPDRIPVMPLHKVFSIKYSCFRYREIMDDYQKFVEAQKKTYDDFKYDIIWSNSIDIVAEVFGCELKLPENDSPKFKSHPISSRTDIDKISINNIYSSKWTEYTLNILDGLSQYFQKEVPIASVVNSPTQTAYHLLGEKFYTAMVTDPALVKGVSRKCMKAAIEVIKDQVKAGANIIFCPNAVGSGDMISKDNYKKIISPINKELFEEIKKTGAIVIYHSCGNFSDRFDIVAKEGADIIHLANNKNKLPPEEIYETISGKAVIMGVVPTVEVMLEGTVDEVKSRCRNQISAYSRNKDFILSADCLLPRDVPPENVMAMVDVAKKYG
ncbi:MAG: uroporphyrinogen decarboxylase family protein [bacterium]